MSPLLATIIDWASLGKTAALSIAGSAVITTTFSLAILWTTRAGELRSAGRGGAANISMAFGVLALVVSIAGVGIGLIAVING